MDQVEGCWSGSERSIFSISCTLQFLYHDLILLENQIPWFVLEHPFSLTRGSFETRSLLQLALDFFHNIFSSEKSPTQLDIFANQEIRYILDLLRSSLVLPLGKQQGQEELCIMAAYSSFCHQHQRIWNQFQESKIIKHPGCQIQ
ncbi:hypothetical protein SLEP1_g48933 [Rubroshorea leprosula]|uniref:Maturase K n=1 Tax=Rubroshorea leprosula TaxID=152421 RepID=A0AAV5LV43_9ROSI|nr:hypothetical protein SLEP1_g48933 [Rubroshorea leprosula]